MTEKPTICALKYEGWRSPESQLELTTCLMIYAPAERN